MWYFRMVSQNMPMTSSVEAVGIYSNLLMYASTAYSTGGSNAAAAAAVGAQLEKEHCSRRISYCWPVF
jgi:hypothetical protein